MGRYWRIAASGISFIVFGIGALIASFTIFPIIYILPAGKSRKRSLTQYFIYVSFKAFVFFMRIMGLLSAKTIGKERLKGNSSHFVIANHPSFLDIVILISLIPKLVCIVKNAVYANPFLMLPARLAGYIKNSSPEELIRYSVDALEDGNSLIIFPEGTRTTPSRPLKFLRGASYIAIKNRKDITPVIISVKPVILAKGQKWHKMPSKGRAEFTIKVAEKIEIKPFLSEENNILIQVRNLNRSLQFFFEKELQNL